HAEDKPQATSRAFLTPFAERLSKARTLREGTIALHFTDGRSAHLECSPAGVQITEGMPADHTPLLEVMGDPQRIQAILEGRKNAVKEFFAGGLRVRGDLGYLSELGMELGILRRPLM
ncbi:MAG: SCP2 sterol-binding domain-containing protein, partial [Ilumatobacteraceae bacterium]